MMPETRSEDGVGTPLLDGLLRPESIAVLGVSARADAPSRSVLRNLVAGRYTGQLHLVGRSGGNLDGHPVLSEVEALPEPVDLAILAVPAAVAVDTVGRLAGRARSAVCFASGFAETGTEGRLLQDRLADAARDAGVRLLGPNCLGFSNHVDDVFVRMTPMTAPDPMERDRGPAVAIVAQSGSIGAHLVGSLTARGVPVAYSVSTGNEADLDLADFVAAFAHDDAVGVVAVYAEQIRRPSEFVAAVETVGAAGRHIVVLHPGRTEASRSTARSHTGAMSGDVAVISAIIADRGAVVVPALEELIDVAELLRSGVRPRPGGLVSINGSGAMGVLMQDAASDAGVPLVELSVTATRKLREELPDFLVATNPLDLGTGLAIDPGIVGRSAAAVAGDPGVGAVLVTLPYLSRGSMTTAVEGFGRAVADTKVPAILSMAEEGRPLWPEAVEAASRLGVVLARSPERALRTLTRVLQAVPEQRRRRPAHPREGALDVPSGVVLEWRGKELLRARGFPVPRGALARTAEEAVRIAARIGGPVAMKVQAPSIQHKSDSGGVALAVSGEADVRDTFAGGGGGAGGVGGGGGGGGGRGSRRAARPPRGPCGARRRARGGHAAAWRRAAGGRDPGPPVGTDPVRRPRRDLDRGAA